jgi:hypothetical protein
MSAPTKPNDREPVSLFELERRQRDLEPGAGTVSDDFPKLPASSPWHHDPCGPEPLIDRREDAATGAPFEHDRGEGA